MAKQVFDLHDGKGFSRGQSNEHLRNYRTVDPEAKKYGYYDPTRMNLNFEVTKGGKIIPVNKNYAIDKRFKDNLKVRGIIDPNEEKKKKGLPPNRNTIANIILGGSRKRMLELAFGDQKVNLEKGADNSHLQRKEDIEKWAVDMYNWVAKKFGEENILAFVVHLDEKNPHVHCSVVPVNEKGRISYRSFFGSSKDESRNIFKRCHDEVAVINQKWQLERGDNIKETGAKHRSSEEYWDWLRKECTRLENKNGGLNEEISLLQTALRKAQIAEKSLNTMILRKQQQIENLKEDLENLDTEREYNEDLMHQEQERLQNLLRQLQKDLEDKQEKHRIAIQRLNELNRQINKLIEEKRELTRENYNLKNQSEKLWDDYQDQIQSEMSYHVVEYLQRAGERWLERLNDLKDEMSPVMREKFDTVMNETFLEELARHGNEIIATATALFFGYIDQATQISASAGGGGSPGGNWGRKKDEDDKKWRRYYV